MNIFYVRVSITVVDFKNSPKYVRIADTFSTVSRTQSSCRKVPFDALPRSVVLPVFSLELIAYVEEVSILPTKVRK